MEKAKIAPSPDWLEDQVLPQQMLCDSGATINNIRQRNNPPNSKAISVHLVATERARCISATDVMLGCACFTEYHTRVNLYITPIVNSICHERIVIQGATDLL